MVLTGQGWLVLRVSSVRRANMNPYKHEALRYSEYNWSLSRRVDLVNYIYKAFWGILNTIIGIKYWWKRNYLFVHPVNWACANLRFDQLLISKLSISYVGDWVSRLWLAAEISKRLLDGLFVCLPLKLVKQFRAQSHQDANIVGLGKLKLPLSKVYLLLGAEASKQWELSPPKDIREHPHFGAALILYSSFDLATSDVAIMLARNWLLFSQAHACVCVVSWRTLQLDMCAADVNHRTSTWRDLTSSSTCDLRTIRH